MIRIVNKAMRRMMGEDMEKVPTGLNDFSRTLKQLWPEIFEAAAQGTLLDEKDYWGLAPLPETGGGDIHDQETG